MLRVEGRSDGDGLEVRGQGAVLDVERVDARAEVREDEPRAREALSQRNHVVDVHVRLGWWVGPVALQDQHIAARGECVETRTGAGVARVTDDPPIELEHKPEAAQVGDVVDLDCLEADRTRHLPCTVDLEVTNVELLGRHPGDDADSAQLHHLSQVRFDSRGSDDGDRALSLATDQLQEEKRPPEGVVGVEMGNDDDFKLGCTKAAAPEVRQHRRGRLNEDSAVDDKAVPIPLRREEVACTEERDPTHLQTSPVIDLGRGPTVVLRATSPCIRFP